MGLAITKTCKNVAEAATLINFLLNEEKGASIMGSECGIPASKAGLKFAQDAGAVKSPVADAMPGSWHSPPTSWIPCSRTTT